MNDDELSAFEKELAELKPRVPSARLRAQLDAMVDARSGDRPRVEASVATAPVIRWQRYAPWLAAAAGLLLAIGVLWWRPFVSSIDPAKDPGIGTMQMAAKPVGDTVAEPRLSRSAYRPLKAQNSLRNRIDDGMVTLENGLSARRYRFQFVDTVVWENPKDGSQFEVSTPREEIVLVPVHTF